MYIYHYKIPTHSRVGVDIGMCIIITDVVLSLYRRRLNIYLPAKLLHNGSRLFNYVNIFVCFRVHYN